MREYEYVANFKKILTENIQLKEKIKLLEEKVKSLEEDNKRLKQITSEQITLGI